ncbi:amidase [Polyangium mundeleinium]|uniref:Amidase n=1 Tax=Polyangium mundeleinium TaxID=2995306 RepID=A0ABT5EIM7_9BACT|nr:amidase [Polyangium mundeleinium]MDC0741664.1 amidase [Polyangium mundeleinium]
MKNSQWMVGATLLGASLVGACAGGTAKGGAGAADVSRIAHANATTSLDIVELSAADARDRMAKGTLTARELTQAYLDRIARIDDAGPRLDAIIELNPRALSDAAALDAERRAGKLRGPLHGIPVLIKDNIDVAGMVNSAGSLALADHRPQEDAFLVARLRAAGAVILGKTNLSEWANFRSTRATSGWSSRGGQTKNPYVLDRNPCGSSSGTGAAIAASLGAIGVGTETDGSILCPSAVHALVGLKPTVGLVSRSGIIPISISQDTAGPMARTVTDAAILLGALAAVDPADPAAPKEGTLPSDYTLFLKPGALRGKRFGVLRQAMGYHPDVDAAAEASMATLRAQGAELVDVEMDTYDRWNEPEFTIMLYEFKDGLNTYLRQSGAPHASLEALIAWNNAHADAVMPFFGQELFEKAQALGPLTDAAYLDARETARRLAGKEGLLAVLDGERLDAVVAPSMAPAWLTDHVLGDHFVRASHGVAAVAGTPSITVPMGESHGLPLGFVFMGRAYAEGELLGMAFAFEQATKARRAPAFVRTLRR